MLKKNQIEEFHKNGYLQISNMFKYQEIEALSNELSVLFSQDSPNVYRQDGDDAIRTVFAPNQFSELFDRAYKLDFLVESVKQLLKDDVYLHQYKFNTKIALKKGVWDWHQDFTFWKDDGMPAPKAITVAVYLDDITEFSGGMVVIPGSHKLGKVACTMENPEGVHDENLKYVIHKDALEEAVEKCGGMVSTKGKKGTVLFFDSNLLHASSQNLYYKNRDILMITYNSVSNAVTKVNKPREDFMVGRDISPIKSINSLLK
ncbi:MAG: phytanoyl-CoA dioxygenase family protein [Polaribacter sp.]